MCGIVGFADESAGYDRERTVHAMADTIAHRGPDGAGFFDDGRCALGHRRLAIIDVEGAAQPLFNEDGRLALVFNGEIYNYRELRSQLEARGHVFATQGDGEVLIHGFEQWGPRVLERLRGMFAFALYDQRSGELFCARDAFGIKPLYYAIPRDASSICPSGDQETRLGAARNRASATRVVPARTLLFASEIKGILPHPRFERRLNEARLATYLCMEYQPDDATLFEGVRKLPAGHWMHWRNRELTIERWFWPNYAPDNTLTPEESAEAIADVLRRSVAAHAIADVEVGCFLSAGVDSSLVANEASKIMDAKTFSIGWGAGEERYSELQAAADFADATGLRNFGRALSAEDFFNSVPAVQYAMDEPLPNPSAVPLYHLSRMAAEQVKVVMSGEGADELFGGYPYYQECLAFEPYMAVPAPLRRLAGATASLLPAGTHGRRFLMRGARPLAERYIRLEYNYARSVALALLHPDLAALTAATRTRTAPATGFDGLPNPGGASSIPDPFAFVSGIIRNAQRGGRDEVTAMQTADILTWMQQDILLKADKMSMAASLELRVPFLDREVFALARTLPTTQRVTRDETKGALRAAAARTLPPATASMPKKGFLTPLDTWLREGRWSALVREAFHTETAHRYFDVAKLDQLLDDHCEGRARNMKKIWSPYCFLIWHDQFFG